MKVTVSKRGQTVIPAALRKKYSISQNSKLEFIDNGSTIIIVPLPAKHGPNEIFGTLQGVSAADVLEQRKTDKLNENNKGQ